MATVIPDANLDADSWENWESETLEAVGLTTAYTPDRSDATLTDISGSELSGGTYARATLTGATRTVDASHAVFYDFDAPDMGTAGQDCGSWAVIDSTDRVLVIFDVATRTAGDPLEPVLESDHWITLAQS